MNLTTLLINIYNAPWPKNFNSESFVLPNDETITKDEEIREMEYEDRIGMARALLFENMDMKGTAWYSAYLSPLETYFIDQNLELIDKIKNP